MISHQLELFRYFAQLIEKNTGILYTESQPHALLHRLADLAKFQGHADTGLLWADIQKNGLSPSAKTYILDLATNNETSFFRDPEVFDFFKNHFVPNFVARKHQLKIWCAATSTGQEPYSLAMIIAKLRASGLQFLPQIYATDISERVLAYAEHGIYTQLEVQRGLSAQHLLEYFEQEKSQEAQHTRFCIKAHLKGFIQFQVLNLLNNWPDKGTFDIIFCRNVLIYQNIENKTKIIARLAQKLNPDGYLVLGGAESIFGLSDAFESELYGKVCVYRLKARQLASA